MYLSTVLQDQDQNSLLVKRRNDNHSPGPVIREVQWQNQWHTEEEQGSHKQRIQYMHIRNEIRKSNVHVCNHLSHPHGDDRLANWGR